MKRAFLFALLMTAACKPATTDTDAGDDFEDPYDGPTENATIPVLDPDNLDLDAGDVVVDAGEVIVDTTCCDFAFSISDQEPEDAVGFIDGELPLFSGGLPLTRGDAGWSATACVPINAASRYSYRFSWDGGIEDGGVTFLEDGGMEWSEVAVTTTELRYSDTETQVTNSEGTVNYYEARASCGADGGP